MQVFDALRQAIKDERPVVLATIVDGPGIGAKLLVEASGARLGTLQISELDVMVQRDALRLMEEERSEARRYDVGNSAVEVLIECYPAPAHLIIVGAVHAAIPLASAAKLLDFRVTVIDPREAYATRERFPHVDALIIKWPDEALSQMRLDHSTYIAVLTHDPKLDDPAVRVALQHPVQYVGALGSQRTQARRRAVLLEAGVSPSDLDRIRGPIGLPLGGRTPGELAISIMAEIVAVRRGKR